MYSVSIASWMIENQNNVKAEPPSHCFGMNPKEESQYFTYTEISLLIAIISLREVISSILLTPPLKYQEAR